jgi:hypothetical protein
VHVRTYVLDKLPLQATAAGVCAFCFVGLEHMHHVYGWQLVVSWPLQWPMRFLCCGPR